MATVFLVMTMISVVVLIAGCQGLQDKAPDIQEKLVDGENLASGLAPFTEGSSIPVFAAISAIVNAILGANQILLGKRDQRLGKILRAIQVAPNFPGVREQIAQTVQLDVKDSLLLDKILKTG